jgi:hypothetical protein
MVEGEIDTATAPVLLAALLDASTGHPEKYVVVHQFMESG